MTVGRRGFLNAIEIWVVTERFNDSQYTGSAGEGVAGGPSVREKTGQITCRGVTSICDPYLSPVKKTNDNDRSGYRTFTFARYDFGAQCP